MTGSFLDTTIVIHIAGQEEPHKTNGEAIINANQPGAAPYYALRELLAGQMQLLCDAYNALQAAENPAEALLVLHSRHPAEGRKKEARLRALATELSHTFASNSYGPRSDQKREMLQHMAIRINGLWLRSHKIDKVDLVQSLSCLNDGKLTFGASGELRGPNDSFNCHKSERCAAAAYLYDDKIALRKMIDALHSGNLNPTLATKRENQQRRKALKELLEKGPREFNKRNCRALGDAYFAAMCPISSAVVTSNVDDHLPLCQALGKKVIKP